MLSLEGRQLGNYTVTRRIRSGGMGAVYEGRQRTAFDRRVAIKVILGTYASDPDMRRRFSREAKTVARLHHPHILPLIEFGDEQGVLYLVMPFIEGGTLTGYLRRHLPDIHEVATIFLQLLEAVEYAHDEGLIHRDIKSSNVLLESRRNGPPNAYLADFGLVRTIQQAQLESSYAGTPIPLDQVPGTPQYMAPEQTLGIVTPSTDIYALGVLLYQMLTGELPYNHPDDIEVIKMQLYAQVPNPSNGDVSIPAELGLLVTRAMAKQQEQRFANVSEFREAFLAALDRPVERIEHSVFEQDEPGLMSEEEVLPLQPEAPHAPRLSQQLRPQPEVIEFGGPSPASTQRHPRLAGGPQEVLPARRPPVTDDQIDDTPRRPRITGDHPRLPEASPGDILPGKQSMLPEKFVQGRQTASQERLASGRAPVPTEKLGPGRQTASQEKLAPGRPSLPTEKFPPGRSPRVTEDRADQQLPRRQRASDDASERQVPGRRQRASEDQPGAGRRPRVGDDQLAAPVPVRRPRGSGEIDDLAPPGALSLRVGANKVERDISPVLARPRSTLGRVEHLVVPRTSRARQAAPGRAPVRHRRLGLVFIGGAIATVFLLLFLLLPRAFGLNLVPAGVPLFGAAPTARIALTVKMSQLRDSFVLTASPQTSAANASTRVMPDRILNSNQSSSSTVATSGQQNNDGTRARGTLHFENSSFHEITVSSGFTFETGGNIQIRLTSNIVIPARASGQNGTFDAPAEAVQAGEAGNIEAGALDSPCCGGQVLVSNPAAFHGGSDSGTVREVQQSDLDAVQKQLSPGLRQQAMQQVNSQTQPGEVQAGTPDFKVNITSNRPVGAMADRVTVTVSITASVVVYNLRVADGLARQLLGSEAARSPNAGPAYQLRGEITVSPPAIEQRGSNGQLYLRVSASGTWAYAITSKDQDQWRQNIKGATVTLAQSYLSTRPGITGVHIDLPFGVDHLPTDEKQIVFAIH